MATAPTQTKTLPTDPVYPSSSQTGLTKREYFAVLALQGVLTSPPCLLTFKDDATAASWSIGMADALIAALNK